MVASFWDIHNKWHGGHVEIDKLAIPLTQTHVNTEEIISRQLRRISETKVSTDQRIGVPSARLSQNL